MLAAAGRLARFLETRDETLLEGAFARSGVVIVENFAPFVFEGPHAVAAWTTGMQAHLADIAQLRCELGPAQDFSQDGDVAYFSLPTTWRGAARGRPFVETGGWSFVLTRQAGDWRVRAYGWAVNGYSRE
jgi:hypothetical protein